MRLTDYDLSCYHEVAELSYMLHTRHVGHFSAAALIDPTGRCVDLSVHDLPGSDIHAALEWAEAATTLDDRITSVVLVSSVDAAWDIDNLDLVLFEVAAAGFGAIGVDLIDWIQVDGFDTVSIAEEAGREPWDERVP